MALPLNNIMKWTDLAQTAASRWPGRVEVSLDEDRLTAHLKCEPDDLQGLCSWLFSELDYSFGTLVVEEEAASWSLTYIFYGDLGSGQVHVMVRHPLSETTFPSISRQIHAADWQEREIEDLFGLHFEGHPRLGDFILHEEWPEGVNPMRTSFDSTRAYPHRESEPAWRPQTIVEAPGAFMMPIGPVYSDHAESAHFSLETVGEDVLRTIPRFFYKYRGLEKIAEGKSVDRVLLLAERFSGTSAFAHSLAFCQAVEGICGVQIPKRAQALRVFLSELERLRHHVAAIAGICQSTGLAVATSQAGILEEEVLRLTCRYVEHRYLFGLNLPGGLSVDLADEGWKGMSEAAWDTLEKLKKLQEMLRFTSSFLDRLEEVGMVSRDKAISYGLVGPVARASGVLRDLRVAQPYAYYGDHLRFYVPREEEGDGYARLRVLFSEAEQSVNLMHQVSSSLPAGAVKIRLDPTPGSCLGWVEAPGGATFHWVRLDEEGRVLRYRVMTPSFVNWHGFHLAAEDFAFQDFPIIMATFALSNAECDR
jgi:formate hydrogenlyase subunit 5